jgi:hypothetical protein
MAANLAGMMNQLNQSILGAPVVGPAGTGMLDMAASGLGGALGNVANLHPKVDVDPFQFMTPGGQEFFGKQAMADLDLTTAEGKLAAAELYGKMGKTQEQLTLAKLGREQQVSEQALIREQQLREKLAQGYQKQGMKSAAERVLTGASDLEEDAKQLQKIEVEERLLSKGLEGRKAVSRMYGVDAQKFKDLGMGTWTDEQFASFTKGMDSEVKAYQKADGTPASLRTHSSGMVWDKDANTWREPSEMGLSPAPQLQKITNVSSKMIEKLDLALVDNFTELYTAANEAQATVDNINRNLGLIDNMPTGLGANVELLARRVAETLGDNPDQAVVNAETYMADAAQRVAKEIKAFGAGTGLSDKDREFTEKMIAGDITLNPESMKRILRIRKEVAEGTIRQFEDVKEVTRGRLGPDASAVDSYNVRTPMGSTPPPAGRTYDPTTRTFK